MGIMVQYRNRTFGYVENRALDYLIDDQAIVAFRRESGWAVIGRDPVRRTGVQEAFEGPDRRAVEGKKSCLTCSQFVDSLCRSADCSSRTSLQGKEVQRNVLY